MIPVSRIDSLIHELGRYSVPFQLWGIWDFDDRLDSRVLGRAVEQLLMRAPVLSCRLERRFFCDQFVPLEGLVPADLVHFEEGVDSNDINEKTNRVVDTVLDIERGPGVAFYCLSSARRTRLVFQLHHILADGRSTANLMTELARLYSDLTDNPQPRPVEPLDQRRGLSLILPGLSLKHWLLMGPTLFIEQFAKSFISSRRFEQLYMDRAPAITGRLGVARYTTLTINSNLVTQIRRWCAERGAKINDFLMTALIVSIHRWNRQHAAQPGRYVPLVFAADMRRRYAPGTGPVANLSSAHRFWLKRTQIGDFSSTAKVVKAKLDRMKRMGLSLDGIAMMLKGRWIPGALARFIFKPVFQLMARYMFRVSGLTNIGPIPDDAGRFGPLQASRCSIVVPIFPAKNVLFAATTYRNRITLEMGYDGAGLSPTAATAFGELLNATIKDELH